MEAAVGKVSVAAAVPVNTRTLSVISAVVLAVKVLYPVAKDPLTSRVEFGVVVPTPTWAKDSKL